VVPGVGGSSPLAHPFLGSPRCDNMVGVAQVVRAPGCGPGGRGFKSPRSPSNGKGVKTFERSGFGVRSLRRNFPARLRYESRFNAVTVVDITLYASVAQLAEQGTLNPKVEGSIPSGRTIPNGSSVFEVRSSTFGGLNRRTPQHSEPRTPNSERSAVSRVDAKQSFR
jgi:hypothetical protein